MRLRTLLMSAILFGTAAAAAAQAVPTDLGPTISRTHPIALSFNYTAMIGNAPPGQCGCFLLNGGSSEELFHLWRGIGAVAQVTGSHSNSVPQSQQGLSLVTYMGGPRYSFLLARRFTPYGQFVVGRVSGFDSYFPKSANQPTGVASSLAFAPGGGVEVGVNDWLSVRAVEAEYLVTRLPNDVSDHQHNLRISAGVVFRFSTTRLNR